MDFEAVFYPEPVPSSYATLTHLALVFDRVIFPGVYIASAGVDEEETLREVERIRRLGIRDMNDLQLLNCMIYAANAKHLADFCVFPGHFGTAGTLEDGAHDLMMELEELVYGPPPENFFPVQPLGFAKGLPGDCAAGVNGPSWLGYPSNALLYAARTGQVLVTDNPRLPVPGVPIADFKGNAKRLATVLAMESVKLVLPRVRALSFQEIAEFRAETNSLARPFRLAMLKLSKELNAAILSNATLADVRREAKFIVDTTVAPELEQFRDELTKPSRPWYRRVVDLASSAPELIGSFATLPANLAVAKVLAKLTEVLADVRDAQLEREGAAKRGAFHYLLKIEQLHASS